MMKAAVRLVPIIFFVAAAACGRGVQSLPASTAAAAAAAAAATPVAVVAAPAVAASTAPVGVGGASASLAAGPCGSAPGLTNGVEYASSWTPYNCVSSPWNLRISSKPTFASYSDAEIANEFANGNTQPVREQEAGAFDYGHAVYYAAASDPAVNLKCTAYCNKTDNGGIPATIHVPAQARPAQGADAQMVVIQPDGTEIDLWGAQSPGGSWSSGATISAAAIANCGNFVTGSGFVPTGPAATASGACLAGGLLRANELLAGSINHALFLVAQCAIGWQYPAFPTASTDQCTSGNGPGLGARLWYDVVDATTNANPNLKPWEKAILNALHDFGGYLGDNMSGGSVVSGIGFLAESGEASWVFGQADPFAALSSQGWTPASVGGALTARFIGADKWQPNGVDFAQHLHWLDPCSAHGSC